MTGLARRVSALFSVLVETAFLAALGVGAWLLALRSLSIGETAHGYLAFPLFPGKALVFVGLLVASLVALRQLFSLMAGSAGASPSRD